MGVFLWIAAPLEATEYIPVSGQVSIKKCKAKPPAFPHKYKGSFRGLRQYVEI